MNFPDIMNIHKTFLIRHLISVFLFLMLALPLSAQEHADSVFMFRFPIGRNEFYSPGYNNGKELEKMYGCVDRFKDLIQAEQAMVYVDGYATTKPTKAANLALAKIRSNRVKSELITLKGLKEKNFITHNHAEEGNFVTVRIKVPTALVEQSPQEPTQEPPAQEEPPVVEEITEISENITETVATPNEQEPQKQTPPEKPTQDSNFALKTNLLDYAILMPNLEVEWMCADRWSVALEGQIAWYSKTPPHKVYRIATIIPEGRFWPIKKKKWHGMYVGLFAGVGIYDLHKGHTHIGHEGEGVLGGISAGYMWPISRHLSLEAGLGVGYLRLRDKQYLPLDGHYLYQLTKNINYFGPLRLKLSLVWRIPK